MPAWFLADLIMVVHFCYVAFVVLLVPVVVAGGLLRWQWVRNSWLRNLHLVMIAIVVLESLIDFECPLTTWERIALEQSGAEVDDRSFVGRLTHAVVFYDFDFTATYVVFGLAVAGLYVLVPPRWIAQRSASRREEPGGGRVR